MLPTHRQADTPVGPCGRLRPVNNPTTAVQVLDQLAEVLRLIGGTELSGSRLGPGHELHRGLVIPVRKWEDYLALGVTEIREFGSGSVQVMRRMRALLEELREEVRPEHRPPVEDELARLERRSRLRLGNPLTRTGPVSPIPKGSGAGWRRAASCSRPEATGFIGGPSSSCCSSAARSGPQPTC